MPLRLRSTRQLQACSLRSTPVTAYVFEHHVGLLREEGGPGPPLHDKSIGTSLVIRSDAASASFNTSVTGMLAALDACNRLCIRASRRFAAGGGGTGPPSP